MFLSCWTYPSGSWRAHDSCQQPGSSGTAAPAARHGACLVGVTAWHSSRVDDWGVQVASCVTTQAGTPACDTCLEPLMQARAVRSGTTSPPTPASTASASRAATQASPSAARRAWCRCRWSWAARMPASCAGGWVQGRVGGGWTIQARSSRPPVHEPGIHHKRGMSYRPKYFMVQPGSRHSAPP